MAVEGLIDGMDLDELWCVRNLTGIEPSDLDYVLLRVRDKFSRIDYFSPNTITCIIANDEERERLFRIPGREILSSATKTSSREILGNDHQGTPSSLDKPPSSPF